LVENGVDGLARGFALLAGGARAGDVGFGLGLHLHLGLLNTLGLGDFTLRLACAKAHLVDAIQRGQQGRHEQQHKG